MTLSPLERESWRGFLDMLRPPPGYELSAALGTTFGLTFEALLAALLAMRGADAEELERDPVALSIAATRLRSRVGILVHPGTICTPARVAASGLIHLMDRFLREIRQRGRLFHPKVWALRFRSSDPDSLGRRGPPAEVGRILVCSRNLTDSSAFEIGILVEGTPAGPGRRPSPFAQEVAGAFEGWLAAIRGSPLPREIRELPAFLRRLDVAVPREAAAALRFHRQETGRPTLVDLLAERCDRALVVSPFASDVVVARLLATSGELRFVSNREALDGLDGDSIRRTQERQREQGSPVLYEVRSLPGEEGDRLDGTHAKLLIQERGARSATLLGSANATGPGLGAAGQPNVEAMAELRPGIRIREFVRSFLLNEEGETHPWVREYVRDETVEVDPRKEVERRLLEALRGAGALRMTLGYERAARRLELSLSTDGRGRAIAGELAPDMRLEVAPLGVVAREASWQPLTALSERALQFDEVALEEVSAFVAVRASSPALPDPKVRVVLADLDVPAEVLDHRDDEIRRGLLADTEPSDVLQALIDGVQHLPSRRGRHGPPRLPGAPAPPVSLGAGILERLLRAVAQEPSLLADISKLVCPRADDAFRALCDDLERASAAVDAERTS